MAASVVAYTMDKKGDDVARAQGLAFVTIQGAINQYLTTYYSQLVQPGGGSVPGVAAPLSPTLAELRAIGALKDPVIATAYNGGTYRVAITTFPAGCAAPNCNLDGLVWNDRPLRDWFNNIDYPRLGVAVRAIGSDGAMSNSAAPAQLLGMQGKWSTANPQGNQPGILAARTGYNSASFSQFYRRDGSLAMTNDVAAGGYSINNANAVNAQKVNLPSGNSLQIGNAVVYGDATQVAIRSPNGRVYMQDSSGNMGTMISGDVQTNTLTSSSVNATNVSATNLNANSLSATNAQIWGDHQVYGNTYAYNNMYAYGAIRPAMAGAAVEGWGCWEGQGAIKSDSDGKLLSCQYGVWRPSSSGQPMMGGPVSSGGADSSIGVSLPSRRAVIITAVGGQAGGSVTTQIYVDGNPCPTMADTSVVSGGNWSLSSVGYCQITLDAGWHVFSTANSRYSGYGYTSAIQYMAM
ncbi:hypothetical protein [Cupriavidus sp. CuC1]|uniref:hypothetical protein n=1 Tax=Cupriavidus sp. CuC1 TaxID=3373131 RepID=UPI0037D5E764